MLLNGIAVLGNKETPDPHAVTLVHARPVN
jgi:hypothetical protein